MKVYLVTRKIEEVKLDDDKLKQMLIQTARDEKELDYVMSNDLKTNLAEIYYDNLIDELLKDYTKGEPKFICKELEMFYNKNVAMEAIKYGIPTNLQRLR